MRVHEHCVEMGRGLSIQEHTQHSRVQAQARMPVEVDGLKLDDFDPVVLKAFACVKTLLNQKEHHDKIIRVNQ